MGRPPAPINPKQLADLAKKHSDEEIGETLGFARVTITGARHRFNIPSFTESTGLKRRNGVNTFGGRKRQNHFLERAFKKISTENSAYYLGLIIADGSISRCGTKFEITLGEPDQHILHEFALWLECSKPNISRRQRPNRTRIYHRLTLCSKSLVLDLAEWGVINAKTVDMTLLKELPLDLERHFLRGFWDGDGHVGKKSFEVGIRSEIFARQLREIMARVGGELPPFRHRETNAGEDFFIMAVASRRFQYLRDQMYLDSSVFLKRKRQKYLKHWCNDR